MSHLPLNFWDGDKMLFKPAPFPLPLIVSQVDNHKIGFTLLHDEVL